MTNIMKELIYKELSYKIVGLAYQIDNELGFGHNEKVYCDALEKLLIKHKIEYKRELYAPIIIEGEVIKKKYFDFVIDDKIIVEIKVGNYNYKPTCTQLFRYLKQSCLKLGLIIRFTKSGVQVKRIPNIID